MIAHDLSFVPSLDNADVITNACAVVPLEERPLPSPLLYHKFSHVSRSQHFLLQCVGHSLQSSQITTVGSHTVAKMGFYVLLQTIAERFAICDPRSSAIMIGKTNSIDFIDCTWKNKILTIPRYEHLFK